MTEKDFKIGTYFIIKSQPRFWSSTLCSKSPFGVVKYPYRGMITEVILDNSSSDSGDHYYPMTDGKYGWSLTELIELDLIEIDHNMMRKVKLEKLKKNSIKK